MAYLTPRFGDIETRLLRLSLDGKLALPSIEKDFQLYLTAEFRGGLTQIKISPAYTVIGTASDPLVLRSMQDEIKMLRETVTHAPVLMWREDAAGVVFWANGPYLEAAYSTQADGHGLIWPLPRLFNQFSALHNTADQRLSITPIGREPVWFEVSSHAEGDGWFLCAKSVDPTVRVENALREFMQTLTKIFAQLPIGLAIFDKQRKLQLFNPALMGLINLPADFLSSRPSLLAVLDAMRNKKMLPEPRNYRGWRQQIVDMEKAAASGLYEETWSLPDGQTYRVVGRPHPNGAIALLIEDISNETLRTRRFRADLELGQSVIDHLDGAIAVFDQTGKLVMSNKAYAKLWLHDPAENQGETTVRSLTLYWRSLSAPSATWAEVVDYVSTVGDRTSWHSEVRLLDGRLVRCTFSPLTGGATLVRFHIVSTISLDQAAEPENLPARSA